MRPMPQRPATLPEPTPEACAHSIALLDAIAAEIARHDGWISFARFMELALYAPGLGYYSGGATKFGSGGDFVTAPEITPAFAQTLAAQVAQIMDGSAPHILEAGAGTGRLAADLLNELGRRGYAPERYAILDLSGELRKRQRDTIACLAHEYLSRVHWLDALPEHFSGCVLGNELLDAMPVHLVRWTGDGLRERGVAFTNGELAWAEQPACELLKAAVADLDLPAGYVSEVALAAPQWVSDWGRRLQRGALLLIDYGFPRREFYHPQRCGGTLMCHYRHHAHPEPFTLPGLQDITAHVDFTRIAEAGVEAGLALYGYADQASFLLNGGLTDVMSRTSPDDAAQWLPLSAAVQKLISPAEMGELFKVICLGRGIEPPLVGFTRGERSHTL